MRPRGTAAVLLFAACVACGPIEVPPSVQYRGHDYGISGSCLPDVAIGGPSFSIEPNFTTTLHGLEGRALGGISADEAIAVEANDEFNTFCRRCHWVPAVRYDLPEERHGPVGEPIDALTPRR